MQLSSSNLTVQTGFLPVKNLNFFSNATDGSFDIIDAESFRKAMKVSLTMYRMIVMASEDSIPYAACTMHTLMELSAPRISEIDKGVFRLDGGIMFINNVMIHAGGVFHFGDGKLFCDNSIAVEMIPAELTQRTYDTYNGLRLGDIGDDVIELLGLSDLIDRDKLAYAYPHAGEKEWDYTLDDMCYNDMLMVKYLSVYVKRKRSCSTPAILYEFNPTSNKIVVSKDRTQEEDVDFDTGAVYNWVKNKSDRHNAFYDQFFIQWNGGSPYGYITVETMGKPFDGVLYPMDQTPFGMLFNSSVSQQNVNHYKSLGDKPSIAVENMMLAIIDKL